MEHQAPVLRQNPARVFGQTFVPFQRVLCRSGAGTPHATPGAKCQCIVECDGVRIRIRRSDGCGQCTQFQTQPQTALHGVEVILIGVDRAQTDLALDAMPGFVHQQDRQRRLGVGQRRHQHGPPAAVPVDCGIRDRHVVGQRSEKLCTR